MHLRAHVAGVDPVDAETRVLGGEDFESCSSAAFEEP
jgi:hypothetical protein